MRNFPWELFSVLKHSDASIPSTDFLIKILKYSCSISDEYLAQKKIDRSYLSAWYYSRFILYEFKCMEMRYRLRFWSLEKFEARR